MGIPGISWRSCDSHRGCWLDPPNRLLVRRCRVYRSGDQYGLAGVWVIHIFEGKLRPHLDRGALEPILEPWWQRFSGPFLYYPGAAAFAGALRTVVDFLKRRAVATSQSSAIHAAIEPAKFRYS